VSTEIKRLCWLLFLIIIQNKYSVNKKRRANIVRLNATYNNFIQITGFAIGLIATMTWLISLALHTARSTLVISLKLK